MAGRGEAIREVREPSRGVCGARRRLGAVPAPWLAPYTPVTVDFGAMLAAPSAKHWLGTDAFGRDVLSRLLYGSQTALIVGFGAALIGATAGAVLGVGSAYFGGGVGP